MFRRIENGKDTYIWRDNWIPIPIIFRTQSNPNTLPPSAKVQDLIDPDTNSWKRELIYYEFSKEEANIIYSIPLSSFGAADKLSW